MPGSGQWCASGGGPQIQGGEARTSELVYDLPAVGD